MKVNRNWLLAIASLVWFIAGFNILRIGIQAYKHSVYLSNVILSVLVFSIFYIFIFSRLVKKHTIRIRALESEKQYFWNFFDKSSFLIMAFMMTGGILLRYSGVVPTLFIAVFYTGLGAALTMAGIMFGVNFIDEKKEGLKNEKIF